MTRLLVTIFIVKKNCAVIKYWFIYTKTNLKNDVKVTEVLIIHTELLIKLFETNLSFLIAFHLKRWHHIILW